MNYLVVDTETTGLIPWKHRLLSVGAVVLNERLEMVDFMHVFIRPPLYTPGYKDAQQVHGLTKKFLSDNGISERKAVVQLSILSARYDRPVIVGHNVAFDYYFIKAAYMRQRIENPLSYRMLDVPVLARLVDLPIKGSELAKALGVVNNKEHDALADARATADCFRILMKFIRSRVGSYDAIKEFIKPKDPTYLGHTNQMSGFAPTD